MGTVVDVTGAQKPRNTVSSHPPATQFDQVDRAKISRIAEVCKVSDEEASRVLVACRMDENLAIDRFLSGQDKPSGWSQVSKAKKKIVPNRNSKNRRSNHPKHPSSSSPPPPDAPAPQKYHHHHPRDDPQRYRANGNGNHPAKRAPKSANAYRRRRDTAPSSGPAPIPLQQPAEVTLPPVQAIEKSFRLFDIHTTTTSTGTSAPPSKLAPQSQSTSDIWVANPPPTSSTNATTRTADTQLPAKSSTTLRQSPISKHPLNQGLNYAAIVAKANNIDRQKKLPEVAPVAAPAVPPAAPAPAVNIKLTQPQKSIPPIEPPTDRDSSTPRKSPKPYDDPISIAPDDSGTKIPIPSAPPGTNTKDPTPASTQNEPKADPVVLQFGSFGFSNLDSSSAWSRNNDDRNNGRNVESEKNIKNNIGVASSTRSPAAPATSTPTPAKKNKNTAIPDKVPYGGGGALEAKQQQQAPKAKGTGNDNNAAAAIGTIPAVADPAIITDHTAAVTNLKQLEEAALRNSNNASKNLENTAANNMNTNVHNSSTSNIVNTSSAVDNNGNNSGLPPMVAAIGVTGAFPAPNNFAPPYMMPPLPYASGLGSFDSAATDLGNNMNTMNSMNNGGMRNPGINSMNSMIPPTGMYDIPNLPNISMQNSNLGLHTTIPTPNIPNISNIHTNMNGINGINNGINGMNATSKVMGSLPGLHDNNYTLPNLGATGGMQKHQHGHQHSTEMVQDNKSNNNNANNNNSNNPGSGNPLPGSLDAMYMIPSYSYMIPSYPSLQYGPPHGMAPHSHSHYAFAAMPGTGFNPYHNNTGGGGVNNGNAHTGNNNGNNNTDGRNASNNSGVHGTTSIRNTFDDNTRSVVVPLNMNNEAGIAYANNNNSIPNTGTADNNGNGGNGDGGNKSNGNNSNPGNGNNIQLVQQVRGSAPANNNLSNLMHSNTNSNNAHPNAYDFAMHHNNIIPNMNAGIGGWVNSNNALGTQHGIHAQNNSNLHNAAANIRDNNIPQQQQSNNNIHTNIPQNSNNGSSNNGHQGTYYPGSYY